MSSSQPDINGLWNYSYLNENCSNGTLDITPSEMPGYFAGQFSCTRNTETGPETMTGTISPPGSGIYDKTNVEYNVWLDTEQVREFYFRGTVNSDGTEITGEMTGAFEGRTTMTKAT